MVQLIIPSAKKELESHLNNKISNIQTSLTETKCYISNLLLEFNNRNDIINRNDTVIVKYIESKNFKQIQELADVIFFQRAIFPKSLNKSTPDYYDNIGKNCYHKCYLMINKSWPCFEELSDRFSEFVQIISKKDYI